MSATELEKDVADLKLEWKEFKSRALLILLGFVTSILAIGIWVGTMQTNIQNISTQVSKTTSQHELLETRVNALEVTNGEIRARLSSIDASLLEIKELIKRGY